MGCVNKIYKLKQLHRIIKNAEKGSIEELAERLSISRKCLYVYISDLENMGAHIKYSRSSRCFMYLNEFEFDILITFTELSENEMSKSYGGVNNYFSFFNTVSFFTRKEINFGYVSIIGQAM